MPRIIPKDTADKRPVLSWSTGKEIFGESLLHRGLFLDHGLDAALDAAATAAGWRSGALTHGDGETRVHWLLPSPAYLYVAILGVPYTSVAALAREDVSYSGIGCRWPPGGRSRLAVQVCIPVLVEHGYTEPVPLTVSSTSTDDLLAALLAHNTVLDRCEAAAAERGRERSFEFWEAALPLVPGNPVQRGQGAQTSSITPIASGHPPQPSLDYLRGVLAPGAVGVIVAERWDAIERWARQFRQEEGNGGSGAISGK
jgi:hypothetical protein